MPDARSSRDAGEPCVRNQRHVSAEWQMLERRRKLICFFHPGTHRTAAREHKNIARLNAAFLDCLDGVFLAHKDTRRPFLAIDTVGIDYSWVDGRAFDERTFRGKVSPRKCNGVCK